MLLAIEHYHVVKMYESSSSLCTVLQVPWARILTVPLDTPTVIEGTTITLVEANHCPGAAMVVAEPQRGPPVLHTGDARWATYTLQGAG